MKKFWSNLDLKNPRNTVDLKDSEMKYIKNFEVLKLSNNEEIVYETDKIETGLIVFEGECQLDIKGIESIKIGKRKSVFDGLPCAAYIPIKTQYKVKGKEALIGICHAECDIKTSVEIINEENVKVMQVGKDNWSREVRMIIGKDSNSVNLLLGETLNPAGNWSGTPPHKHEGEHKESESVHEELYYFKTEKMQGWGMQRNYSEKKGFNELIYLKENIVTFMPYGYHQVVAAPGYNLYYMFFLAGEGKDLMGYEDPEHKWIKSNN